MHDRNDENSKNNTRPASASSQDDRRQETRSRTLGNAAYPYPVQRQKLTTTRCSIFSVPWNTLTSALETLAESHQVLAQRIEVDVERPLRDFGSTNREMQAMTTIQGNLVSMAKDVENAQKKSERLNSKGSNNASRADTELEGAQSQWTAQAPYVFESLQALDETRLNHLRDVLTQFQTHEIDAIEKTRVSAESVLNILLNIETADEIKTYALRVASGDMVPREKPKSRQSMFIAPSLAPTSHHDDGASTRSGTGMSSLTT